ncbi:MAG: LysM peptidoglycan-binding domain-containing protein [Desulfamplus sp.]|nr:LysM peptidoglycan-binding domain-containing protein [Desulfamplus sp.]
MFTNTPHHIKSKLWHPRPMSHIIDSVLFISFFIFIQVLCHTGLSFAQQEANQPQGSNQQQDITGTETKELSPESKNVYNVKKHDTLWDISDKTLKSPERWPELWGQNPHIRNPHWIYPGDTIYLRQQKNSSHNNSTTTTQTDIYLVPPLERVAVNPPYYYFYPLMGSVGYIKESAVTPAGKIMSCMPKHQKKIEQGNGVYLAVNDESDLMVGDQFQIVRTFYIRDRNSKTFPLVHHYITGIVEITKLKAKPCKCHEQISQVEGKIITAYRTIQADDILVPYNSMDSKILVRQSNEQMNAKILFSEDHKTKISENSVVFIDKGQNDGLQTGQFYEIFNQPKGELIDSDKFIEKTEHIGSLVVLRMEDKTSSALITYAYKDIAPGDIMVSPSSENAFDNITMKGQYK